ncbi:MAG: 2-oxo acid dehydrogenase subunit E2, partial [Spirochaetales bacterium]|nr:2-oxo acid dehydrogenase subunit E2 [Spirochaetales bacterium]
MAEQVLMTALSPTMEEGTIVAWNKKEGSTVSAGEVLCEVETDKATMDYESTQEGTLLKVIRGDGSTARVGEVIAILGEKGEDIAGLVAEATVPEAVAPEPPAPTSSSAASPSGSSAPETLTRASPLARKMAVDRGIDIAQVPGTGPAGRVVKRDVERLGEQSARQPVAAAKSPGEDITIAVAGARAVIARRLSESKYSAPHYYLKSSVRMESVLEARRQLNGELPEKVGFNAFLVKFVAEALKRHPGINASWQGDHILQFGSIDIGLAVDRGKGLITPIVRNCGNRGVVDIDRELRALIAKAGEGKLQPSDYTGATFTITNLGSFGVEEFTAIINPPGSAILAVGAIAKTVVVDDTDNVEVAQVMKMTLSC